MGIDAAAFRELARSPRIEAAAAELKAQAGGRAILLGVDRLDYTKGLPRRLTAFASLLERDESLRDRVRLIQVAVPSREAVADYQAYRREVEEAVGRINGLYGTLSSVPVHYLYQSVSLEELVALYRAADAAPFTPARLVEIEGPAVGDPASTLARWARFTSMPAVFIGDGAVMYADQIVAANPAARVLPPPLIAGALGRLAIARHAESTEPAGVRPLYVRRPDAEIARDLARDGKHGSPSGAAETPERRC